MKKMDSVVEELKKVKIIDENDIIMFKNYIYKKYPGNTASKNAKILSDTIHRIIYKNLEGLPEDSKQPIKSAILKNTLGNNKTLITLYDVFDSCIIDENLRDNFIKQLIDWINIHVKTKVEINKLKIYLESKNEEALNQVEKKAYIESKEISVESDQNEIFSSSISNMPYQIDFLFKLNKLGVNRSVALVIIFIIFIPLLVVCNNLYLNNDSIKQKEEVYVSQAYEKSTTSYPNVQLPEHMRYRTINEGKLRSFLDEHNSILSKEPYFSTILSTAKEFNLNPIILFSITGQEQNFVPKDEYNALKIANNPFNVYHSWREYNTNIRDASNIAARTLINLSRDMPGSADPFLWIGKKYAEDRDWGKGVEKIFNALSEYVN